MTKSHAHTRIHTRTRTPHPAPLSETVDHTADFSKNEQLFVPDKSFSSFSPSNSLPSSTPSSDSEDEDDDVTDKTRKWKCSSRPLIDCPPSSTERGEIDPPCVGVFIQWSRDNN